MRGQHKLQFPVLSDQSRQVITAWGLLNAVTEYVDHHKRARNQGNRLDNAWFGEAANLKDTVFKSVLEMAG